MGSRWADIHLKPRLSCLGQTLQDLRLKNELTLQNVADLLGASLGHICALERGLEYQCLTL